MAKKDRDIKDVVKDIPEDKPLYTGKTFKNKEKNEILENKIAIVTPEFEALAESISRSFGTTIGARVCIIYLKDALEALRLE